MKIYFFIILLLTGACGKSNSGAVNQQQVDFVKKVFATTTTTFAVPVYYEPGAEPYDGNLSLTGPETWSVTEESYKALFAGRAITVTVPKAIANMTVIAEQNKTSWSAQELINLAHSLDRPADATATASVAVIFVNGTLGGDANVLGVQFGGEPYAFIFKDIVVSTGGTVTSLKYVEQAVVTHEVGHAAGAVNNGLPMTVAHEDTTHAHHSTDTKCVMYWAVESKSGVGSVVDSFITLGSQNLFGEQMIADAKAYHP